MQENEFEKRVREEMGELRLRPSEMVWDKVELQLKKKKKRRVVFFIFLLAGLSLLGSGGYFIYHTNEKQNLAEQKNIKAEDNTTNNNETKDSDNNNEVENVSEPQNDNLLKKPIATDQKAGKQKQDLVDENEERINLPVENAQQANDIAKSANKKKISPEKFTEAPAKRLATVKKGINKLTNKLQAVSSAKKKKTAVAKDIDDSENVITQQKKEDAYNEKPATGNDKDIVSDKRTDKISAETSVGNQKPNETAKAESNIVSDKPTDKIGTETSVAGQKPNETAKTDSAIASAEVKEAEKPVEQKKKKPSSAIKWGIDVSAGSSKIGDNAFSISIFESIFENKSMADAMYNSPGNVSGGSTGIPVTPPSDIKRGFAFKVGVVAEKNISKKSSLSTGLSYVHYSNTIKAGVYRDTSFVLRNMALQSVSLNAYYRGPQQEDYTNRYHFIQLPVYYQLQLNKGLKTPLLWNIGVSAGYLFSTNALVYDTAARGIYYRDKEAFNKVHFNLNTGFAFRFGNKKLQYSVGPELSMDMRRLMKDAAQPKQYFFYAGLTGRVLFTKKK